MNDGTPPSNGGTPLVNGGTPPSEDPTPATANPTVPGGPSPLPNTCNAKQHARIADELQFCLGKVDKFRFDLQDMEMHTADPTFHNFVGRIKERVAQYERRILAALEDVHAPMMEPPQPWSISAQLESDTQVRWTGPTTTERWVTVHDQITEAQYLTDEYFEWFMDMCNLFSENEVGVHKAIVLQAQNCEERRLLSACSPEAIVDTHKRLLQEYNEIKDVGQQLIGLVADNRGVPIHSLYGEDGPYGVTADD